MQPPIAVERLSPAPPEVVHRYLTDVTAWALWSPHISWVKPDTGRVVAGWKGEVKAWFAPVPTVMEVDWVQAGRGMAWHTRAFGHLLTYTQTIEPARAGGSLVRFEATVAGPLGGLAQRLARPLSALGQRRRLARLTRLAELAR